MVLNFKAKIMRQALLAGFLLGALSIHASPVLTAPKASSGDHGPQVQATAQPQSSSSLDVTKELCVQTLKNFKVGSESVLRTACSKIAVLEGCQSVQGVPIYHYDRAHDPKSKKPMKILVISLIHGDEVDAGIVGRYWIERLEEIEPRNTWRVIPVMNPDGYKARTRTNASGVDVNRNFPTKDWSQIAIKSWEKDTHRNLRRFPGNEGGSEPETRCAMKHFEDFKPDFVVSVHTPLRVLDFDGPRVPKPNFNFLPWKSLGHYPGSLGRFLWHEREIPVLTMELSNKTPRDMKPFEALQDIIGQLAAYESPEKKIAKQP